MHLSLPPTDHPIHLVADVVSAAAGGAYVTVATLNLIDTSEKVIIGALVILLLILRIRSHIRRDAADKQRGGDDR